jgi:hypothetical protein
MEHREALTPPRLLFGSVMPGEPRGRSNTSSKLSDARAARSGAFNDRFSQISSRNRTMREIVNMMTSVTVPSRVISRCSEIDLTSSHSA